MPSPSIRLFVMRRSLCRLFFVLALPARASGLLRSTWTGFSPEPDLPVFHCWRADLRVIDEVTA